MDNREAVIQTIAEALRRNKFTFEFRVVKNPKGIKIIHELTQQELDSMMQAEIERRKNEKK